MDKIKEFCLSSYTSFSNFITDSGFTAKLIPLGEKYLGLMQTGKLECTHEFYLKYYHMLLANGSLNYDEFDFIALDEAGDLNAVTLEIFKLLPAKKKIMVGDQYQNIYTFNHTINCFDVMAGQGTFLPMSQSFRVADHIATRIEKFCQKNMDPTMQFKGMPAVDDVIKTRAYIARTNASLIGKMIELNRTGIQYGLTRTTKQIFDIPLIICNLKHRGFISNPEVKHLQADVDFFYTDGDTQRQYKSVLAYIRAIHSDDTNLINTINLVLRYTKTAIVECYNESRKHEKANQSYMLGTAHSTKGLEFDHVELGDDLNSVIDPIVAGIAMGRCPTSLSTPERTELNLYYVALSRARKSLANAKHL